MRTWFAATVLAVLFSSPAVARAAAPPDSSPAAAQPAPGGAAAQPDAAEQARLEAEIARALGQAATPPAQQAPAGQGATGGSPLARLLLLPDLSAVGSFAAVLDGYDAAGLSPRSGPTGPSGKPTFLFQELELALQAVVDPYARADVFVSFTPGEVAVEEAYLTTLSLPGGLQLRSGRLFSPFGRLNPTHPHTWDFLDAPLAHDRLLGEEKLAGPGVDASWLAPLPWFAELHLAAQSTASYAGQAERFTGVARLAQFVALSEAATLGVGLSAARRDEGTGAFRDLGGVDLLVKVRPPAGRAALTLQGELFTRRLRGEAAPGEGGPDGWGAYLQLFWRQDAYSGIGLRWDRAPVAGGPGGTEPFAPGAEQRWSLVGDWFASEFQRLGLQASLDRRPGAAAGWEWLLHYEFVIGAHGAHPF
ncbi:MAG TPA: hypothetical protein VIV59_08595 [Anaeromyxobacteraceae bacterium]